MLDAPDANIIGITIMAQINIVILRPLLTVHPCFIKEEESQPPPILPTSAIT